MLPLNKDLALGCRQSILALWWVKECSVLMLVIHKYNKIMLSTNLLELVCNAII
jgi:hypothetical protein